MNKLIVTKTKIYDNKIEYKYEVIGEWKKYFKFSEEYVIEYSKKIDIENTSLANVPLITNFLPIAWVLDAEIEIEELDKNFYDSINDFKKGYIDMYPSIEFKGGLKVRNIIDNSQNNKNTKKKPAVFFSGGVDAYQTLISHLKEEPLLLTIWGADIHLEDTDGWANVKKHTKSVANDHQLDYLFVKSTFRMVIDEGALTTLVWDRAHDGWWHGFQHGLALLGHIAPYVSIGNISVNYIASSFTIADKGRVTCASDPTIDDFVKFASSKVIHDGYDYSRQEKIANITQFIKQNNSDIKLRVCWKSSGGKNCCRCEKCYRTILGILAEGGKPVQYGFNYNKKNFKMMMIDLRTKTIVSKNLRYKYIQDHLRKNMKVEEVDKNLIWFYNLEFDNKEKLIEKYLYKLGKIKEITKMLIKNRSI